MKTLGTYSTIDCPHVEGNKEQTYQKTAEAKKFLEDKLGPFFTVRLYSNPHDFGAYQSFEIDWSPEYSDLENFDKESSLEDDIIVHDRAIDHFNAVEELYNNTFTDCI